MPTSFTFRHACMVLLLLTLVALTFPFSEWMAYQSNSAISSLGWMIFNVTGMVAGLICMAAIFFLLLTPIILLLSKQKREILWTAFIAISFIASMLAGVRFRRSVWHSSVVRVTTQAEPLIQAIESYQARVGKPPEQLTDLVPRDIAFIPTTGIGVFPEFRYYPHEEDRYQGNPWVLDIHPPCMIFGFDRILYFPQQNYPEHGFGGSLERIGSWAYVHE